MYRHCNPSSKNIDIFKISCSKIAKSFSALMLIFLFLGNPVLALTQQEAQAELNQINNEINSINGDLANLRSQKTTLKNELATYDAQAYAIQLQINAAQYEIDVTNGQITQTNSEIVAAIAEIERQKVILNEYVRVIYMDGQTSELELILTSNSFSDFVDQSEYLNTATQKINDASKKIEETKILLEAKKLSLEVNKARAESLKSDQVSKKAALDMQRIAKSNLIAQTNGSESAYQSLLNGKVSRKGILECIAAGGCNGDANGDLLVVNTPLHYYQWDPAWANYEYDSGSTLGNYGCLITSLAMVHGVNPIQESQKYTYSNGGLVGSTGQVVTGNWGAINSALANGKYVIFGIRMDSGYWSHFVLAKGMGDGKYYINDPYFSAGRTYNSSRVFNAIIPYQ